MKMPQRKRRENQFILRGFQLQSYLQAFEETLLTMWERCAAALSYCSTSARHEGDARCYDDFYTRGRED